MKDKLFFIIITLALLALAFISLVSVKDNEVFVLSIIFALFTSLCVFTTRKQKKVTE